VDAYPHFPSPIIITSQHIDNVTVVVEQVFDDNEIGMMAIEYTGLQQSEKVCIMEQQVGNGLQNEITAECIMGYSEVVLYLSTGSTSGDQYEPCTIPNGIDYVAHTFKVPCTPVCKPEAPDCFEGPLVTISDIGYESDICVYDEMPIIINNEAMSTDWVNFTVDNTWSSTGYPEDDITSVSISYINSKTGQPACHTFDAFPEKFGSTGVLQAQCVDGMTTVVVNVHSSGIEYQADHIIANQCHPPSDTGTCAYEIIIPCDPKIQCDWTESPTEQPTDFPTSNPTDIRTESPTAVPTEGFINRFDPPTTPPPTEEKCPPSEAILIAIDGATMYREMPIQITSQNTTHVGFSVVNTFGVTISSVFTQYNFGSFGQNECLEEQNVGEQITMEYLAQCRRHTKISIVNVWMSDCSEREFTFLENADNAEIPECCHAGQECKTVQYTFKLPCEPEPCPEDDADDNGRVGVSRFGDDSSDAFVIDPIAMETPAPKPTSIPTPLPSGSPSSSYFPSFIPTSLPSDSGFEEVFHVSRDLPRISSPSSSYVHFSTPIPPPTPLPSNDSDNKNTRSRSRILQSLKTFRDQNNRAESDDPNSQHYCSAVHYPCVGEDGDGTKVHICHYSPKEGYKTYCVPEADSDVVEFYPKDYCGPCVGGFATS